MRRKAGLTQRQLASRVGLSQGLIAKIERGVVDPRVSTLRKILSALVRPAPRELNARNIMTPEVISVRHDEPVSKAIELMTAHDVSQLPVTKEGSPVGCVEEDHLVALLSSYLNNPKKFYKRNVMDVISGYFPVVSPDAPLPQILELFIRGHEGILVKDAGKVLGIITKIDVLRALSGGL